MRTLHFSGLWALEWAWHLVETILRCARSSRIYMPNPKLQAIISEIPAFIRTDRQALALLDDCVHNIIITGLTHTSVKVMCVKIKLPENLTKPAK